MFKSSTPQITDKGATLLAREIANNKDIRMAKDVEKVLPYPDDLVLQEIGSEEWPRSQPKRCWFNCKDYVALNPTVEIVFGWEICRVANQATGEFGFYAMHHAVVRSKNSLINITPDDFGWASRSLFLPDSRVPFDYQQQRHPACFYLRLSPDQKFFWTLELGGPPDLQSETYMTARRISN